MVVNKSQEGDTCSVNIKYGKNQATLDGDFDSGEPYKNNREVGLRKPPDKMLPQLMLKTLQDILDMNEEYPIPSHINQKTFETPEGEFGELESRLVESITDLSEEYLFEAAEGNCLIVEVDGKEYPYIYLGTEYDSLRDRIIDHVRSDIDLEELMDERGVPESMIERSLRNLLVPRFGRGRFIEEKPSPVDGVRFVPTDPGLPSEEDPVRISNIEEYLVDNNIVENLSDFSFESLVFEEDGEKYDVPYDFVGSGLQSIVHILWELFDEEYQGEVLMIEEPENNLHPEYIIHLVQEIVRISDENNIQMFITTHDTDFIDAFFSEPLKEERESYLIDNFQLTQLTSPLPRTLNYERSREKIEDLHADLRGGK